jgi:ethanolamine permease
VLLATLGVAAVIAGHFAGWNFGIGVAGWGGMLLSLLLMTVMYFCMIFSLAELASIIPTAGGGYGFARRAFGPTAGYITGVAIAFGYIGASAVITVFISAYCHTLLGIGGWPVHVAVYSLFTAIHVYGVGEALKFSLLLAVLAAMGIVLFVMGMAPFFDARNLLDVPSSELTNNSALLPFGLIGIWAALPFSMSLFLAVEVIPLASEEAKEPKKNVPRGMVTAMLILMTSALLIVFAAPGGSSSAALVDTDAPMIVALSANYGDKSVINLLVNIAALIGLMASLFSIIFAFSRQVFSLSRAGYLPRFLSNTNRRKSPYIAVMIPGLLGFLMSLTGAADQLLIVAFFSANLSYILMMAAHIKLRVHEPDLHRPYVTPGGKVTSCTALLLAALAFSATLLGYDPVWTAVAISVLLAFYLYFVLYSRHHLVAQAPEEEFEALQLADAEIT